MATPNLQAITTVRPGHLATPARLANGEIAAYTVGAGKAAKIAKLVLANTSGAAVTVAVSILPSGATASDSNRIVPSTSLAAGDTTIVSEADGMWLGEGAFVSINSSAATAIVATLTGLEFS